MAFFNPKLKLGTKKVWSWEACLSVPGYFGKVERSEAAEITYLDENAEEKVIKATGLVAFIFQHETDHLLGSLYTDKVKKEHLVRSEDIAKHVPPGEEQLWTWRFIKSSK